MEKQFVTYEIAKQLKELGFDKECMGFYITKYTYSDKVFESKFFISEDVEQGVILRQAELYCVAPLWQQARDWFREKHNLHITIEIGHDEKQVWYNPYIYKVENTYEYVPIETFDDDETDGSYPAARELAVLKAIKLIKDKK